MTKTMVHTTDLLQVRPAEVGEMVKPGQFAKDGDMIIVRAWPDEPFLIHKAELAGYVEVELRVGMTAGIKRTIRRLLNGECPNLRRTTIEKLDAMGLRMQRERPLHETPLCYPLRWKQFILRCDELGIEVDEQCRKRS